MGSREALSKAVESIAAKLILMQLEAEVLEERLVRQAKGEKSGQGRKQPRRAPTASEDSELRLEGQIAKEGRVPAHINKQRQLKYKTNQKQAYNQGDLNGSAKPILSTLSILDLMCQVEDALRWDKRSLLPQTRTLIEKFRTELNKKYGERMDEQAQGEGKRMRVSTTQKKTAEVGAGEGSISLKGGLAQEVEQVLFSHFANSLPKAPIWELNDIPQEWEDFRIGIPNIEKELQAVVDYDIFYTRNRKKKSFLKRNQKQRKDSKVSRNVSNREWRVETVPIFAPDDSLTSIHFEKEPETYITSEGKEEEEPKEKDDKEENKSGEPIDYKDLYWESDTDADELSLFSDFIGTLKAFRSKEAVEVLPNKEGSFVTMNNYEVVKEAKSKSETTLTSCKYELSRHRSEDENLKNNIDTELTTESQTEVHKHEIENHSKLDTLAKENGDMDELGAQYLSPISNFSSETVKKSNISEKSIVEEDMLSKEIGTWNCANQEENGVSTEMIEPFVEVIEIPNLQHAYNQNLHPLNDSNMTDLNQATGIRCYFSRFMSLAPWYKRDCQSRLKGRLVGCSRREKVQSGAKKWPYIYLQACMELIIRTYDFQVPRIAYGKKISAKKKTSKFMKTITYSQINRKWEVRDDEFHPRGDDELSYYLKLIESQCQKLPQLNRALAKFN